jgi:hypothetical protein
VLLAASSGADAVGIPVNDGDRIVLFVNVSVLWRLNHLRTTQSVTA